jgi:hypothetical protein
MKRAQIQLAKRSTTELKIFSLIKRNGKSIFIITRILSEQRLYRRLVAADNRTFRRDVESLVIPGDS